MKEEAPPKKPLPPKKSGGGSNVTPTKAPDEILSSLLRLNNYDSFSSIKDESLDIDLSACVTINAADSAPALNGNSFSSTDFWRMLDENAQTPQLECNSDESMSKMSDVVLESSTINNVTNISIANATKTTTPVGIIKTDNLDVSFGDKFLRPNPPAAANVISPMRKTPVKNSMPPFELIDQKILNSIPKELTITRVVIEPVKLQDIKMEPIEVLPDILVEEEKLNNEVSEQPLAVNEESLILYKCMNCDGAILRKQDIPAHESALHRLLHVCGICTREFEQEAGLKKHLKTHRAGETRKDTWRKCPDCGKCLKLGSMWMHRKIHSDNKKYGCDICGQKFVQKINLTHHSRVHTAEKPYECPECQKRFQERSHLQRHQKYHAQTRSYRCEKCGKMYKTERCLKVHNLVHLEQRPFACNVCDKSFISNSKLKQHSNIHTGERPFKCNYCPRDFTNFPNWLKHTRRRHKVDHKTGLQLENIPSYCSKKSTKTTKSTTKPPNNEETPPNNVKPKSNADKTTNYTESNVAKIKGETTSLVNRSNEALKTNTTHITRVPTLSPTIQLQQQVVTNKPEPLRNPPLPNNGNVIASSKLVKTKRERKQSMPRQVQKQPKNFTAATMTTIKKEPNSSATNSPNAKKQNDFPDLHGLSLTSAEELIMEQALEMEECGLYDAPSIGETDNAISAEAAAALQFKIKSEFIENGSHDEFVSLKDLSNNRLLCSSLESSPYSSPASVELTATTTKLPVSPTNTLPSDILSTAGAPLTTYYMQPFALNAQGTMLTRLCSSSLTPMIDTTTTSTVQLIPQILVQTPTTTSSQVNDLTNLPTTQALINQFFLPMTVNMQSIQNKQVLPSVETLLSAHANASIFGSSDKSTNTPTQLSSSLALQRNLS